MTADNIAAKPRFSVPAPLMSALLVILPTILGIGAGIAALTHYGELKGALANAFAGYGGLFHHTYSLADAFLTATAISRADIAILFVSMLFRYMDGTRALTAAALFLRSAAACLAVSASLSSPLASSSLLAGAAALMILLFCALLSRGRDLKHTLKDRLTSVAGTSVAAGAVIAVRTALLLAGALLA